MSGHLNPTRVAIIEDHTLLAESMEIALTMEGHEVRRINLPTSARSPSVLLPPVLQWQPRVALLDLDLGLVGNGMRLVEPLTQAGVAVVVVTGTIDDAIWGEALRFGARRVLPKDTPFNEILATIRRITQGLAVTTPDERDALLRAWHDERAETQQARERLERLTRREAEVLAHLIEGHQVREVARIGVVSEATVRTQVKSILAKLEVSSQLAAVGIARQAGWHAPDVTSPRQHP
ncbi:LuxR C-terminal-related transcriptional regulator [Nocardioides sp.]|uniref:helix-turn-helix transcriptional regulator n=1 Tax=Nocardioides sp. TaxID=35761 RepID=UPI002733DD78|nr:LuxR C-terminal-related transcriptional regulator [Nocardioides sp.]MDP3892412.1 LuxR C-terminal-related transcriptional regulator [Nocardioides sp.]